MTWYTQRVRALLVLTAIAGCKESAPPPAPPPPPVRDAGVDAITMIPGYDPMSGMHLDDDTPSHPPVARPQPKLVHPIDIILRSSPSGARAAVDGTEIDRTPTFVQVEAGKPHEFTFNLEGYAFARYRFVPVTNGVVHARLDPIAEDVDAGVPPEVVVPPPPAVVPPPAPLAPPPPAPVAVDATQVAPPPPADAGATHSVGPTP